MYKIVHQRCRHSRLMLWNASGKDKDKVCQTGKQLCRFSAEGSPMGHAA